MPMDEKEQKAFDDLKKSQEDGAKALEEANKRIKEFEEKEKNKGKKTDDEDIDDKDDDEDDLDDKVRKKRESDNRNQKESRTLENSLKFNMTIADFAKGHKEILPGDIEEIITAAEKENYDSANDKANSIRVSVIKSFFSVQENIDLLTPSQKKTVEDYLKLTQNGRRDKAQDVYDNIFEPALASLKRLRKAEELGRSRMGISAGSKADDAYKAKLMAGSRKTYLGEKGEK